VELTRWWILSPTAMEGEVGYACLSVYQRVG
jgi:hypothetical protein